MNKSQKSVFYFLVLYGLVLLFGQLEVKAQVKLIEDPFTKEVIIKESISSIAEWHYEYESGSVDTLKEGVLVGFTSFNDKGEWIVRKTALPDEEDKQLGLTREITYMGDSMARLMVYDYKGDLLSKSYSYMEQGNPTEWVSYDEDSVSQGRVKNSCDDQGNLLTAKTFKEDGSLQYHFIYEYDATGELIRETRYVSNNEAYVRTKVEKEGPLIRVWKELDDDGYPFLVTTKIYDELGRLIREKTDGAYIPDKTYAYFGKSTLIDYIISTQGGSPVSITKYRYTRR